MRVRATITLEWEMDVDPESYESQDEEHALEATKERLHDLTLVGDLFDHASGTTIVEVERIDAEG